MSIVAIITAIAMLFTNNIMYEYMWNNADDEQRMQFPLECQSYACGMDPTEFEFMARVIEMESDRTDSIDGKILIAAVIFNRADPDTNGFPDTITGVLCQDGQFSTVSGGWCNQMYTTTSRWAIVEAQRQLASGDIPENLLYFNCIGYDYGTPYGYVDGNYFSLG